MALLLIIGLGGLVAYQSHTSRVLALNTFDDSNAILTRTLADNMASSVKYAREEALINSYKEISQNPRAGLDGIMVSMADGKVLNSFGQPAFDAGLLKGFGRDEQAAGRQEHRHRRDRRRHFVMVPVTYGPQRDRIGSLAVAWSRDAVMSEIAEDAKARR